MRDMARKAAKRVAGFAAGAAVFALLLGGWGMAAHAQYCDNANCMLAAQRASDPAYQAAIHSGWYSPYQYSYYPYPSYIYYPYSSYPYFPPPAYSYQYQYQYQYQYGNPFPPQMNPPYWMNGGY